MPFSAFDNQVYIAGWFADGQTSVQIQFDDDLASAPSGNALTLAFIAATVLFAPTVAQAVTTPTIGPTATLNAPTVAHQVTLPTIGPTAVLTAPSVAPGPVTLTLPAIGPTVTLASPIVGQTLALPAISLTQLFTPTIDLVPPPSLSQVARDQTLTPRPFAPKHGFSLIRSSWNRIGAPAVPQAVTLPAIGPSSSLAPPMLAAVVSLPTISLTQLFTPTITTGNAIALPTISGTVLHAPTVAPGPVSLTLAAIPSGSALFAPTVAYRVSLPLLGPSASLSAPSLAAALTLPTISGTVLRTPTVTAIQALTLPLIGPTSQARQPGLTYTQIVNLPAIAGTQLYTPAVAFASIPAQIHLTWEDPTVRLTWEDPIVSLTWEDPVVSLTWSETDD